MRPLCILMAGVLLFSCSKDDTDDNRKPGKPVIEVMETQGLSLTAEAGSAELHYTVENATDDGTVGAECTASWIELQNNDESGIIQFAYAENAETESRSTVITLTYPGAEEVQVNVTQLGSEKWVLHIEVTEMDAFKANIKVTSTEAAMPYVLLNLPKSDYDSFTSDEELTSHYIELFRSVASSYGLKLEDLLAQLLYVGDTEGSFDKLTPETEYVAVAFGLNTDATVTSEVFSCAYTTPAPPYYDQGVSISVKTLKPNYMEVETTPGSDEYRYYADVLSQEEFDAFTSMDEFADAIITQLQELIDINNAFNIPTTWDDVTAQGYTTFNINTLFSNTTYTPFAFGISNGYRTTDISTQNVTTPEPNVTSDCTFAFETVSADPALAKVRITPSDNSEYFAIIALSSEANSMTPERYADECIVYANTYEVWNTWTGEQVLEAADLSDDTDYTIVVFGVGDYYERNTKVNYYTLHTNKLGAVDITFDLQVTETTQSTVSYFCTPSDLEQTWAVGAVRKDKHDSFASEEEFKEYLLTAGNGFPIINTGAAEGTLMYDCEWSLLQPGDYLLYAVACYNSNSSYTILSDLTYLPFTIEERVLSDAATEIELIVYDGDELVAYDPEKFPAEDYAGKAAIDIVFTPNTACAAYYVCLQSRPASVMEGLFIDTLIEVIKAYGDKIEGNASATFGVALPWEYNNYCIMGMGVDSNGMEGQPTIVSLNVSRDQIVPFNPASAAPASNRLVPVPFTLPETPAPAASHLTNGQAAMPHLTVGGALPVMKPQTADKLQGDRKQAIVESRVRRQIEQAGGKYYTPAERKLASEFAKVNAFSAR